MMHRVLVALAVVLGLAIMIGIGLLPPLYLEAQRLGPLEGDLATTRADLEKSQATASAATADAEKAKEAELAIAQERDSLKSNLEEKVAQVASRDNELEQERERVALLDTELKKLGAVQPSVTKELREMERLLGVDAPAEALSVLRERLERLATAEQQRDELRGQIANRRDSGWREPAARITIPVEQSQATVMMTCPLPAELPTTFRLNPGESVLSSTPWYRVETP